MKKLLLSLTLLGSLGTTLDTFADGAKKPTKTLTPEQRMAALEAQFQKIDDRLKPFEARYEEAEKSREKVQYWSKRILIGIGVFWLVGAVLAQS